MSFGGAREVEEGEEEEKEEGRSVMD